MSIAISDDVNVIAHANSRPKRKSSRLPLSFSKNSKSKQESHNQVNHEKCESISETASNDFDPDFLLSTVFGYQDVIIKSGQGLFTIFE